MNRLFLTIFITVLTQVAQAASWAELLESAWQRHPQAVGLEARDNELRADHALSEALTPEPASVSLGNLNDRQDRNLGKQEWEVELVIPLWLPGQKTARTAVTARRTEEALARRTALRLEVAGAVREAWAVLALARAGVTLAVHRLESARALHASIQKYFKAGERSRIDVNLSQSEVLAAEAEVIETQMAEQQAEQTFQLLVGKPAPLQLEEEQPVAPPALHPQLAATAALAHSARAAVKMADETQRATPELALRAVRERGSFAEAYGNTIGIRLKIPFSSAAQVRRESSKAQAEADQADADRQRTERRVQMDIERARQTLDSATRQLTMASERHALSADNLRLTEKAFALGESDLATLLRIRAAAYDAEGFRDRSLLARAAALSRLNQALGVLP